jgi:HNH endonuclease
MNLNPTLNREPTYICIYCKRDKSKVTFEKEAHVIPEALGGTKKYAPKGFECDQCNNFFATIETKIVESYPFMFERVISGTISKRGKYPIIDRNEIGYKVEYRYEEKDPIDRPWIHIDLNKFPKEYYSGSIEEGTIKFSIPIKDYRDYYANLSRFLIKMGLGLMLFAKPYDSSWHDSYAAKYDLCRKFTKEPKKKAKWELLTGDTITGSQPQLRQYDNWNFLRISDDSVFFCYKYGLKVFVCRLDEPKLKHYQSVIEQIFSIENSQVMEVEI